MQAQMPHGQWEREREKKERGKRGGRYLGLAKRFLLGDGIIVPVDEAEDAEESSSSWASGDGLQSSTHSSPSSFFSSSSS